MGECGGSKRRRGKGGSKTEEKFRKAFREKVYQEEGTESEYRKRESGERKRERGEREREGEKERERSGG